MTFIEAYNAKAKEINDTAIAKGWWKGERNEGELIALIHSELSEALDRSASEVLREFMQAFADRHQGGLQPDMFTAPAARKPRQSTKRKAI